MSFLKGKSIQATIILVSVFVLCIFLQRSDIYDMRTFTIVLSVSAFGVTLLSELLYLNMKRYESLKYIRLVSWIVFVILFSFGYIHLLGYVPATMDVIRDSEGLWPIYGGYVAFIVTVMFVVRRLIDFMKHKLSK